MLEVEIRGSVRLSRSISCYGNVGFYNLELGIVQPHRSWSCQQNPKGYSGCIFRHIQNNVVTAPIVCSFDGSILHVVKANYGGILVNAHPQSSPSVHAFRLDETAHTQALAQ